MSNKTFGQLNYGDRFRLRESPPETVYMKIHPLYPQSINTVCMVYYYTYWVEDTKEIVYIKRRSYDL